MTDLLLIVDVQKGFINDHTAHVPAAVAALQDRFEAVCATRFVNPEGSMHRRLIHWARFAPGSDETGLAFSPQADARVWDKTTYTCAGAELSAALAAAGADRVVLAGIATDNCILKTAVDLFEQGIEPVVVTDACGSHGGPDCHDAGLLILGRMIGQGQFRPAAAFS